MMRDAELNQTELPNRWAKFQDVMLVTSFVSASAFAMFGWLVALGWFAEKTTDWFFGFS